MGVQFPQSSSLQIPQISAKKSVHTNAEMDAMMQISQQLVGDQQPNQHWATHPDDGFNIDTVGYPNGLMLDTIVPTDNQHAFSQIISKDANGPARRVTPGLDLDDGKMTLEEGVMTNGVFKSSRQYEIDIKTGTMTHNGKPVQKPTTPTLSENTVG